MKLFVFVQLICLLLWEVGGWFQPRTWKGRGKIILTGFPLLHSTGLHLKTPTSKIKVLILSVELQPNVKSIMDPMPTGPRVTAHATCPQNQHCF